MGLYFNGTDKMWRSDMCVHEQVVKLNHRVNRCVGCLNKSRLMHRMKKKLLLSKKIDRDQQYQTILEAEVELGMGLLDKEEQLVYFQDFFTKHPLEGPFYSGTQTVGRCAGFLSESNKVANFFQSPDGKYRSDMCRVFCVAGRKVQADKMCVSCMALKCLTKKK